MTAPNLSIIDQSWLVAELAEIKSRLTARVAELEAERDKCRRLLGQAELALQPFSDRVFNDNGDCTVTDTHTLGGSSFIDANLAYSAIRNFMKDARP